MKAVGVFLCPLLPTGLPKRSRDKRRKCKGREGGVVV